MNIDTFGASSISQWALPSHDVFPSPHDRVVRVDSSWKALQVERENRRLALIQGKEAAASSKSVAEWGTGVSRRASEASFDSLPSKRFREHSPSRSLTPVQSSRPLIPNKFYKTRLCEKFKKGLCTKPMAECKYAHGQKDMRAIEDNLNLGSDAIRERSLSPSFIPKFGREKRTENQDKLLVKYRMMLHKILQRQMPTLITEVPALWRRAYPTAKELDVRRVGDFDGLVDFFQEYDMLWAFKLIKLTDGTAAVRSRVACLYYNDSGVCKVKRCTFASVCDICFGRHSRGNCPHGSRMAEELFKKYLDRTALW